MNERRTQERRKTALRVLIVEDDLDTTETLSKLLELEGHETAVALDGVTGVDVGRTWHPDVVLLDIALPNLDGWSVATTLRETTERRKREKSPLIVAISGLGEEDDRRRSEESGIHLHLVKPVDPEAVLGILRRFDSIVNQN